MKFRYRLLNRALDFLEKHRSEADRSLSWYKETCRKYPYWLGGHSALADLYFARKEYQLAELALLIPLMQETANFDRLFKLKVIHAKIYLLTQRSLLAKGKLQKLLRDPKLSDTQRWLCLDELAAIAIFEDDYREAKSLLSQVPEDRRTGAQQELLAYLGTKLKLSSAE